jgi:hypothetical protein
VRPGSVTAPRLRAAGLLTGWGRGVGALPADARAAAAGRPVVSAGRPAVAGDRFRRATRESLLAVAAVEEALREAGISREALAGDRTALLYATLSAYGASNRAFIEGTGASTLHFPYTAPSAVPAEVTIEFRIRGPYVIFLGGAPATLAALWWAAGRLAAGECDRALVLAVETFDECADLYAAGRWVVARPLVEAAACALLEPGAGELTYAEGRARRERPDPKGIERRLGEAFAATPLVALGVARASGGPLDARLEGAWRGTRASLSWVETDAAWSGRKS